MVFLNRENLEACQITSETMRSLEGSNPERAEGKSMTRVEDFVLKVTVTLHGILVSVRIFPTRACGEVGIASA